MKNRMRIEATYRKEGPRLRSWLESRVGEDAEDLLHDVLARALGNLDALEPVRDLGAWFWRSVRNAVIDLWRSRRRRAETGQYTAPELDDLVDEGWRDAFDEVEEQAVLEALAEAIEGLPPDQRDVIVAQGLRGETFASISRRTGVPIETLAARKRYGLEKIREALVDF